MRPGSQVSAVVQSELNAALFALEGKIVSVAGGRAVVQPTPQRSFDDNSDPVSYPVVENVRLVSLVWDGNQSGISGRVKPGDECLLVALSHGDGEAPDHKTISNAIAFCGYSDVAKYPTPDSAGIRVFSGSAFIEWDGGSIKADTGQGATAYMVGNTIAMVAPGNLSVTAPMTTFNGNVTITGGLAQLGTSEGSPDATFGANVIIQGTSKAADHNSGGVSGRQHQHTGNGDGSPTSSPIATLAARIIRGLQNALKR